MRKVSVENIKISPTSCPAGEADVAGLHQCDHRALPAAQLRVFSQFPFFKAPKKEKNLSQTISFYWRTYLFLGLTCYLATLKEAKICVEG